MIKTKAAIIAVSCFAAGLALCFGIVQVNRVTENDLNVHDKVLRISFSFLQSQASNAQLSSAQTEIKKTLEELSALEQTLRHQADESRHKIDPSGEMVKQYLTLVDRLSLQTHRVYKVVGNLPQLTMEELDKYQAAVDAFYGPTGWREGASYQKEDHQEFIDQSYKPALSQFSQYLIGNYLVDKFDEAVKARLGLHPNASRDERIQAYENARNAVAREKLEQMLGPNRQKPKRGEQEA